MARRIIGRHKAFLKAFATCGSITKAAKAAGVDRGQHYEWLKEREGYAADFAEAANQAAQVLEDEAVRRAYEGVFEPNVWQGSFVYPEKTGKDGTVHVGKKPLGVVKYSDTLLQFLLKGLRPERYRDRVSAEVTGKDGGPIPLEDKRLATLTDDELTSLITLAKKLESASDGSGAAETKP